MLVYEIYYVRIPEWFSKLGSKEMTYGKSLIRNIS